MSGFSADWLALRAPFDDAARSPALARRFAGLLPRRPRIVDLGAGTGAARRALAPVLGEAARWTFVEGDPLLLRQALADCPEAQGECCDLARGWTHLLDRGTDGVTAFALLDLATAGWVEGLARALAGRSLPFYAPLIVDGRMGWAPRDPDDALVGGLFALHQRRPKGLGHGSALGPAAPLRAAAAFRRAGARVLLRASDWRIPPAAGRMLAAMVDGAVAAATQQSAADAARVAEWGRRRHAQLAAGRLSLLVGHRDLLAVPRRRRYG